VNDEGRVYKDEFDMLTRSVGVYSDGIRSINFFLEECDYRASLDFMDCLLVIEKTIRGYLSKLNAKSRLDVLTREFALEGPGTTVDRAISIITTNGACLEHDKVVKYVKDSARFFWNSEHFMHHELE
jgi:hypothetical protein